MNKFDEQLLTVINNQLQARQTNGKSLASAKTFKGYDFAQESGLDFYSDDIQSSLKRLNQAGYINAILGSDQIAGFDVNV